MTSGIYYIKNKINNKYYIGQSINIDKRRHEHYYTLKRNNHRNIYLQRAFNKYDENAFEFKLIKACKPRYLNRFEKLYIKIYNSYKNGYNMTQGGDDNPMYGKHHTVESRKKMSISSTGKRHKEEDKINMSYQKNSTGYYRVYKRINTKYKQGFIYAYQYYNDDNKRAVIQSIDINKLEKKVKSKGLPWYKFKN